MGRRWIGCLSLALALAAPPAASAERRGFSGPMTSSPIALSADGKLVWAVNPKANTVSVLRAGNDRVLATIAVGKEPRAVALDPTDRYAYVANAAGANVSVIRIRDARASHFRAGVTAGIATGAEPWNVVAAPDGRRVYVRAVQPQAPHRPRHAARPARRPARPAARRRLPALARLAVASAPCRASATSGPSSRSSARSPGSA